MRRRLIWAVLLIPAACHVPDWRLDVIDRAEMLIRSAVADPDATFSHVQVTGDDRTGQTCGVVTAKGGTGGDRRSGRFIVYIDGTAGPYVEPGLGEQSIAQDDFDPAWAADCVKEGYKS